MNLYQLNTSKDFFVWVDPNNFLVQHQIKNTGGFTSGGIIGCRKTNLMFIPNPDFKYDITPFHLNLMGKYIVEYNLELSRIGAFQSYPSRLNAIFLFSSENAAQKYGERHQSHVLGRLLLRVKSCDSFIYSEHDSSWIDFMRLGHSLDPQSIDNCCKSYWKGINLAGCALQSLGKSWTEEPILESLFIGRIEFYDKNL